MDMVQTFVGSWSAMLVFTLITSITPGPNNLMLLQGGMERGFWACRRHMLGISLGCGVMVWLSFLGLAALVLAWPPLQWGLKLGGSAYLLWFTWSLWRGGLLPPAVQATQRQRRLVLPLGFTQAVLFQWINPKAWAMALAIPGLVLLPAAGIGRHSLPVVALFVLLNLVCIGVWAWGGQFLQRLWRYPRWLRMVHGLLVGMSAYCVVALWY